MAKDISYYDALGRLQFRHETQGPGQFYGISTQDLKVAQDLLQRTFDVQDPELRKWVLNQHEFGKNAAALLMIHEELRCREPQTPPSVWEHLED